MAIGNPITLTSNVASKTISAIATAGQTLFTVTGGYRINQLAVFRNGVRLLDSRDYEARNGSTVTLLSAATVGDALEFQVFDDFRVADAIVSAESEQTISGNLTVSGGMTVAGLLTATDISLTDVSLRHLEATGISTVSDTTQSTSTTTGAFIVSGGVGIAKSLFVGGNVSVGGTLSYEDVINVDSVGIITARSHVSIADSILHTGDTDTSIRFPAADTFTVETSGEERLRVTSEGKIGIGNTTSPTADLEVAGTTGTASTIFVNAPTHSASKVSQSVLKFGYAHSGSPNAVAEIKLIEDSVNSFNGNLTFSVPSNNGSGGSSTSEALRIKADGNIGIGTANPSTKLHLSSGSATQLTISNTSNSMSDGDTMGTVDFSAGSSNTINARVAGAVEGTSEAGGDLVFETRADGGSLSERLRIQSDGTVKIGTGTGNPILMLNASTSGTSVIQMGDSDDNNIGQIHYANSDDTMRFFANNAERLRITGIGSVGIGTDDPNRLLHLQAASSTAYSGGSDTADYNFLKIENTTNDKSAGVFFMIGSNGEAAITATEVADGNTDICFQNRGGGVRSEKMRLDSGGTLFSFSPDDTTPNFKWRSDDTNWHGALNISVEGGTIASFWSTGGDWSVDDTTYSCTKNLAAYPSAAIALHNQYSSSFESKLVFLNKAGGSTTTDGAVTELASISSAGVISDSIGPLRRLGIQGASNSFTLAADHAGKLVRMNSSAKTITLPQNIFTAGDMISIFNVSTGDTTIASGTGITLHNSADASTGDRTLGAKGICTIVCSASNEFVISGSNLS